jgi:hypothetical protein
METLRETYFHTSCRILEKCERRNLKDDMLLIRKYERKRFLDVSKEFRIQRRGFVKSVTPYSARYQ